MSNKIFNIYIDHAWTHKEKDGLLAKRIKDRLKSIKQQFYVRTFSEIEGGEDYWEERTFQGIDNADIIIPIISADYLAFITPGIEQRFNEIFESDDKYIFPILYKSADWGSYNWLVKSKLLPEDGKPLSELSDNDSDKILNSLVRTINEIILNYEQPDENKVAIDYVPKNNIVFISHDHDDGDFAELLKLQLEKNGINAWIDSERLKIGQDWREEIDEGITNSIAVIAIMTPEARKSEYVTYEWAFAWGKGKRIFPLMLKQTQLHPRLESLQYLDFTNRNSRPYEILINSIKEMMQ